MARSVKFTKMHGAGNDYIYVDTQQYNIPNPSEASIAWSKYHTGIGKPACHQLSSPQPAPCLLRLLPQRLVPV